MITNNPTLLLNSLCQELGLSDSYAELTRQGYDMASFIGQEKSAVKEIFKAEILEDLHFFADNLEDAEIGHPHVAIRIEAAKALGLIA
jgi:hypothetical protein